MLVIFFYLRNLNIVEVCVFSLKYGLFCCIVFVIYFVLNFYFFYIVYLLIKFVLFYLRFELLGMNYELNMILMKVNL